LNFILDLVRACVHLAVRCKEKRSSEDLPPLQAEIGRIGVHPDKQKWLATAVQAQLVSFFSSMK